MNDEDALNEDGEVDALMKYLEEPVRGSTVTQKYFCSEFLKMNVLEMCERKDTPILESYAISVALLHRWEVRERKKNGWY